MIFIKTAFNKKQTLELSLSYCCVYNKTMYILSTEKQTSFGVSFELIGKESKVCAKYDDSILNSFIWDGPCNF